MDGSRTGDVLQEQASTGETLNHSVRLSMTEPLGGGNTLEIFGERRAIDENQGKTVFDLDEGTPVFNPILSSKFDRTGSAGTTTRLPSRATVFERSAHDPLSII